VGSEMCIRARPADVRPYLANVLRGRRFPGGRVDAVAHHYELFGGHSPLTELTLGQAAALEADVLRKFSKEVLDILRLCALCHDRGLPCTPSRCAVHLRCASPGRHVTASSVRAS